jgi:hypothetical protein
VTDGERSRWAPLGTPDPPEPWAEHTCEDAGHAGLEWVPDPHEPAYEFPAPEVKRLPDLTTAWAARSWRASEPPWPTLLIGVSAIWPVKPVAAGPHVLVCGACLGRPLPPYAACLWCDRWGRDE